MTTLQHTAGTDGASLSGHECLIYRSGEELGLTGMLERARSVGGTLEVESEPGQGTRMRARLPVDPR